MSPKTGDALHRSAHRPMGRASGRAPRPPRALVTRERLLTALDRGSRLPLSMLVAPAGTGKTVLLADWAARREEPVLWISASHDADALDKLLPPAGSSRDEATPEIVVIDDAHLLPAGTFEQLSELLAKDTNDVRLLMASRYDLPLPVFELELRGQASTLRSRDLQFSDAEAAALVHAHAGGVSDSDVRRLQERAGGWAGALVLGARAIDVAGGRQTPVLTERPVLDLLLGETFDTMDEQTRKVLICTFGETDVTARMATVLSGDKAAGAILADLAASGLLVTAYGDGSRTTYRYHPLLVELLRRFVAASSDNTNRVLAAHRRAAVYFEHHGDGRATLRHALAASEPDLLARMLLLYGPAVLAAGDVELVAAGFDGLPDDYVEANLHLCGVRGILRRLSGDLTGALMDAGKAAALLAAGTAGGTAAGTAVPDQGALETDVALLRLWEARLGWYDIDDAIRAGRALLDRASHAGDRHAVLGVERLAWLLLELAEAETLADQLDAALGHLDDELVTARMARQPRLVGAGLADRAVIELVRSQVQSAARSAQSALDAAKSHGLPDEYIVRAQLVLALAALNRLDIDEARRWQRAATRTDAAGSDVVVEALRATMSTAGVIEEGLLDEARLELASDPRRSGPMPTFLVRDLALLRLWVAILVGDQASVAAQIIVLEESGNTAEAALVRAVGSIGEGTVRTTLDAVDAALSLPDVHPALAASVKAFRTILLLRMGDGAVAEEALADLLNEVAPQHLLHPLAMASLEPAFMDLLRTYAGRPAAHPFAEIALDKLTRYDAPERVARAFVPTIPAADESVVPSPRHLDAVINGATIRFTAREAEVLDQLSLGSSYAEIAQTLYITENTVKTHLMSLYRKLGVEKRSAALRTARSVGLI